MQILIFFFLWNAVFSGGSTQFFGYDKAKIFTYAFVLIIVRAFVLSSRSVDVAGQIANGEITNLLLKPVNYFYYWLTRDFSSKVLNIIFGVVETVILVLILKPTIFIQTNPFYFLAFIISLVIAMLLFFNLLMLTNFVPFWVPELSWGAQFLVIIVVVEFLSGSFFPLDVFPPLIYQFLRFTPFPYLIFIPIKIYLGNFSLSLVLQSLAIGAIWCLILWKIMIRVWKKGLFAYDAVGR
jgi:ABC-2 type transport system permease protein